MSNFVTGSVNHWGEKGRLCRVMLDWGWQVSECCWSRTCHWWWSRPQRSSDGGKEPWHLGCGTGRGGGFSHVWLSQTPVGRHCCRSCCSPVAGSARVLACWRWYFRGSMVFHWHKRQKQKLLKGYAGSLSINDPLGQLPIRPQNGLKWLGEKKKKKSLDMSCKFIGHRKHEPWKHLVLETKRLRTINVDLRPVLKSYNSFACERDPNLVSYSTVIKR